MAGARSFARRLGLSGALIAVAIVVNAARADDPTSAAHVHFQAGKKAFDAKDFATAGAEFEEAYRTLPHADACFNAALAWENAGDEARAANLYKTYLSIAKPDDADRDKAQASVAKLGPKLGRAVFVVDPAAHDLRSDGAAVGDVDGAFFTPGEHVLTWVDDDGQRERRVIEVAAGKTLSLVIAPTAPPAASASAAPIAALSSSASAVPLASAMPTVAPTAAPAPRGITPIVAITLGSVTAVAGALVIASGVDVLNAKADFDARHHNLSREDQQSLIDAGRAKTDRTNVALALFGAFGVATAITLGFTNFHGSGATSKPNGPTAGFEIGPTGAAFVGAF